MGTRNVADLQLWWSHPNYTPQTLEPYQEPRQRPLSLRLPATSSAWIRASRTSMNSLIGSGVGQMFTVKEYLGVSQDRKRRRQVNVKPTSRKTPARSLRTSERRTRLSSSSTPSTPTLASWGNGVKRPLRLYVVFTPHSRTRGWR